MFFNVLFSINLVGKDTFFRIVFELLKRLFVEM